MPQIYKYNITSLYSFILTHILLTPYTRHNFTPRIFHHLILKLHSILLNLISYHLYHPHTYNHVLIYPFTYRTLSLLTPHLHSLVCHSIQSTTNLHLDAHIASFLTLIAQSLHDTNTIPMSNDVIIPHPRTDTSFQKSIFSNPVAHPAYTHKILTVLLHSRTGFESL